jgi:hypothetical protein
MAAISTWNPEPKKMLGIRGASMYEPATPTSRRFTSWVLRLSCSADPSRGYQEAPTRLVVGAALTIRLCEPRPTSRMVERNILI